MQIDEINDVNNQNKYWKGNKNKAIRYYYYTQKGLELLNEFRYLVMIIFGLYLAMKVDNILILPLMFVVSLPALVFLGWVSVHHMKKVMEWIQIRFATHWSLKNYEWQEERNEILREILVIVEEIRKGRT